MGRAMVGIVALAAAVLAVACGDGGGSSSQELVPEGSNIIASIQLDGILADEDVAALYAGAPHEDEQPTTLQEFLDLAQGATGLDARDFTRVVVFGNTDEEDFLGIIAEGTFDQDSLPGVVQGATGEQFTTSTYKGHDLYAFGDSDNDPVLAFPEEGTLVFGNRKPVRQVIDVFEGDRSGIQGPVLDTFAALGDPWFKVAVEVPEEALEDISEAPLGAPIDLSLFADIRVVGLALDKSGDRFSVSVDVAFAVEDSAADVGEALDGLLKLVRVLIDDEQLRTLLDGVEITTNGLVVTVVVEVSVAELQGLIDEPPDFDFEDLFEYIFEGFRGDGETEANDTELQNIQTAVISMMVDNNLTTLPNVVAQTDNMTAFPDATSVPGSADKLTDPAGATYAVGDGAGYLLFGHDITANAAHLAADQVNYLASNTTKCSYTVAADGTVTQVSCP